MRTSSLHISARNIPHADSVEIETMYQDFAELETPLGKPWIGTIQFVPGKALIFGPNAAGEYIYVYKKNRKTVQLAYQRHPKRIRGQYNEKSLRSKAEVRINPDFVCSIMQVPYLMEALFQIVKTYVECGECASDAGLKASVYQFNDSFERNEPSYEVDDFWGHSIYQMEETLPLQTLNIFYMETQELVFQMNRRKPALSAKFDFYLKDKQYGTLKKTTSLHQQKYSMDCLDGLLEVKRLNALSVEQYIVTLNGRIIGGISDHPMFPGQEEEYPRLIFYVQKSEYLILMISISTLIARIGLT